MSEHLRTLNVFRRWLLVKIDDRLRGLFSNFSISVISLFHTDKGLIISDCSQKLSDIDKLKQQKAAGKQLELNQLQKIDNEAALLHELAQLRL